MNPEAKVELDRITSKEPRELTKEEKAFLNARSAYLRPEQKMIFRSVLRIKVDEEYTEPESIEVKLEKKKK